jgi:hypothetical protein
MVAACLAAALLAAAAPPVHVNCTPTSKFMCDPASGEYVVKWSPPDFLVQIACECVRVLFARERRPG